MLTLDGLIDVMTKTSLLCNHYINYLLQLFHNEKLKKHQNDENFDKNAFLERCKEQWRNLSLKKRAIWIKWALEAETKYLVSYLKYTI